MVESLMPVAIWLTVGVLSCGAGLVSVALANRRFRLLMGQPKPEFRVAPDRQRSAPVSKAA